jgi:CBS domain-containing protein
MAHLARDIMNREVISVPRTMDLRELGKLFLERGITGAPVVDEVGKLVGVISQTDLVYYNLTRGDELVLDSHFYQNARVEGQRVPTGFQIEDFNTGVVADVMTPIVHSVPETATVDAVARMMLRKHIHRVIVRRGRGVAGIISALDVLRVHARAGNEKERVGAGRPAPKRAARSRAAAAGARRRRAGAGRAASRVRRAAP